MASTFESNAYFSFKIISAHLWYGDGPFDFGCSPEDKPEEVNPTRPTLCLNLMCENDKLGRLVSKGSAIAYIHRHPTDRVTFKDGVIAKGEFSASVMDEDETDRYLEVAGVLPEYLFDAVASALTCNSNEVLAGSYYLVVGLNKPWSQINFGTGGSPLNVSIFVERLAIRFDIEQQDDDPDME